MLAPARTGTSRFSSPTARKSPGSASGAPPANIRARWPIVERHRVLALALNDTFHRRAPFHLFFPHDRWAFAQAASRTPQPVLHPTYRREEAVGRLPLKNVRPRRPHSRRTARRHPSASPVLPSTPPGRRIHADFLVLGLHRKRDPEHRRAHEMAHRRECVSAHRRSLPSPPLPSVSRPPAYPPSPAVTELLPPAASPTPSPFMHRIPTELPPVQELTALLRPRHARSMYAEHTQTVYIVQDHRIREPDEGDMHCILPCRPRHPSLCAASTPSFPHARKSTPWAYAPRRVSGYVSPMSVMCRRGASYLPARALALHCIAPTPNSSPPACTQSIPKPYASRIVSGNVSFTSVRWATSVHQVVYVYDTLPTLPSPLPSVAGISAPSPISENLTSATARSATYFAYSRSRPRPPLHCTHTPNSSPPACTQRIPASYAPLSLSGHGSPYVSRNILYGCPERQVGDVRRIHTACPARPRLSRSSPKKNAYARESSHTAPSVIAVHQAPRPPARTRPRRTSSPETGPPPEEPVPACPRM
ncbi:hypothetical protein C8R47DRAFT_1226861 [Mycena vitilis]|nr:hypothetical protein C8R47DRAFT_1226861 [Mycena vitilis]